MKHTFETTKHDVGLFKQMNKVMEEMKELMSDMIRGDINAAIIEAHDLIGATGNFIEKACEEVGTTYEETYEEHYKKNDDRGYYVSD